MQRTLMVVALATLAGAAPLGAQQQQAQEQRERERQERAELERRMRELQSELRDVQRQLNEVLREERGMLRVTPRASVRVGPRAVIFPGNQARIGVTVRGRRDLAKDSIGAEVTSVTPGGPAQQAGIRTGDIITTFNRERLAGRYPAASEHESEPGLKLQDFARDLEDGDTVQVEYRRGNERGRATIVARELDDFGGYAYAVGTPGFKMLETEPLEMARAMVWTLGGQWLDMELVSLNPELGEYFGTNEGLLVIRAPQDTALNLRGGDVILRIDGRTPNSHSQLMRIFRSYSAGESVQIEIMRQKRRMTVSATIPERTDDHHDWNWEHR